MADGSALVDAAPDGGTRVVEGGMGTGGMAASGGASPTSGGSHGSGGQAAAGGSGGSSSECEKPGQKRCGGICVSPNVEIGCGLSGCAACQTVENGYPLCDGTECGFECNTGFERSGSECAPEEPLDVPPECTNGDQDGNETDVDCGGDECARCGDGKECTDNTDCASGVCGDESGTMACRPASCGDGVQNGAETDEDCGGNCGATCEPGESCDANADCASGSCESGVCGCTTMSCSDVGNRCGEIDDGCGGAITCQCASGETCASGTCRAAVGGFPYTPTNFEPSGLDSDATDETTVLDCGVSTFDSTSLVFGNWCNQSQPSPVVRSQPSGPEVVVVPVRNLNLAAGSTLRLTGTRPVVFAVFGNATIAGVVDASANGTTAGAGGNLTCGNSQGGNGSGDTSRFGGASGGGGGGFGTRGGAGGRADTDGSSSNGGVGGETRGSDTLSPLMGGCAGGQAGDCSTAGGGGGGAVQFSTSGSLRLSGTVRANGANGATPCGANDEGGGTGGGSGGGILLEGSSLDTSGGTIEANGGRGGANGRYAGIFNCGGMNGGSGSTNSSDPGGNGGNCQGGSPGGGGGYGRTRTVER